MRIPTTGYFPLDLALAILLVIAGLFIVIKKESKWGWIIIVAALVWGYRMVAPFYGG